VEGTLRDKRAAAPVALSAGAAPALRPLPLSGARGVDGFRARHQQANRSVVIPAGRRRLQESGAFGSLRRAAGLKAGRPEGPVFTDSDVCKWLEAVAREQARAPSQALYLAAGAAWPPRPAMTSLPPRCGGSGMRRAPSPLACPSARQASPWRRTTPGRGASRSPSGPPRTGTGAFRSGYPPGVPMPKCGPGKPDLLGAATVVQLTGRTAGNRAPLYQAMHQAMHQAKTADPEQPGDTARLTRHPVFRLGQPRAGRYAGVDSAREERAWLK
jgi:hypothetical protein